MLKTITILPYERAIVLRNGFPVRWLGPGRRTLWGFNLTVRRFDLREGFMVYDPDLVSVIPDGIVEDVMVPVEHRGFLSVDGVPKAVLEPGRYLLWQERVVSEVEIVSLQSTASLPRPFVPLIPSGLRYTMHVLDSQRGLVYRNGELVRLLEPGEHTLWNIGVGNRVEHSSLKVDVLTRALERVVAPEDGEILDISDDHVAVYAFDGVPQGGLRPGRYFLWKHLHTITAVRFDISGLFVDAPERLIPKLPVDLVHPVTVLPYQRALVYINGELVKILEEGLYAISRRQRQLSVQMVDLREQQLQITGQEVMTADKVSLRLNLILNYQITDPRKSAESTTNLRDMLYSAVQMAARGYVAGVSIDHLLEHRDAARDAMSSALVPHEDRWGVSFKSMDLKDIILPGEMKVIFNRVIEAEKRAAANVITRREETAATRSLANTARMLENNPTLMRLKELESFKEVAELVGDITVVSTPEQLLGQLSIRAND
ncbi:MAG: slipin family protein [Myxococcota bacterium]